MGSANGESPTKRLGKALDNSNAVTKSLLALVLLLVGGAGGTGVWSTWGGNGKQLDKLEQRLDGLATREQVEGLASLLKERLSANTRRLDEQDKRLDGHESRMQVLPAHGARLDAVERRVDALEGRSR